MTGADGREDGDGEDGRVLHDLGSAGLQHSFGTLDFGLTTLVLGGSRAGPAVIVAWVGSSGSSRIVAAVGSLSLARVPLLLSVLGRVPQRHFTWTCLVFLRFRQCSHCVIGRPFFLISKRVRSVWEQADERCPLIQVSQAYLRPLRMTIKGPNARPRFTGFLYSKVLSPG